MSGAMFNDRTGYSVLIVFKSVLEILVVLVGQTFIIHIYIAYIA